jgi:hypothetical protein
MRRAAALIASCLTACASSTRPFPDVAPDAAADAAADTAAAPDSAADTAAAPDTAADTAAAPDSAADSAAAPDSAPDSAPADPLAPLTACLGAERPLTIAHQLPYQQLQVGAAQGLFLLDLATTFSSIDLAAFASSPTPPVTHGCDPTKLGVVCAVDGFAFFGPSGTVSLVTEDFSSVATGVRQAGIVGTDFTSLKILTLSYARGRVFGATQGAFCTPAALRGAGLHALSTAGWYASDLAKLLPMSAADAAASTGKVPNVPTIPVRVAGVSAVAQLDTGFDDALVPFSANVNRAFYDAIVAKDPAALVAAPSRDLVLTTCASVAEPVKAYTLAAGRSLAWIDDAGAVARAWPGATIFVKDTPAAARSCGGIGTWTTPAAQLAASFFVDAGALIFDPYASTVWAP